MRGRFSLIAVFRSAAAIGLAGAALSSMPPMPYPETSSPEMDDTDAALRHDANIRAEKLAGAAPGPYEQDTERMQKRLDDRFAAAPPHPFYDRAIVINPGRVDAMAAMGPTTKAATGAFLSSAGYPGLPEDALSQLNSRLQWQTVTPLGNYAPALNPAALSLPDERICVIVPALPYALPGAAVPGLGLRESMEFYNRHEDWHCLDGFYDARDIARHGRRLDWKDMKSLLNEPEILHAISLAWRKEALADVGALGDMIRDGARPGVIGPVSNWRLDRAAEDIQHCSTPALRALEAGIVNMGLDAFRRLGDQEAAQFYYMVVEERGLSSAEAVRAFIIHSHGTAEEKAALEREAKTSAPIARGIAMAANLAPDRSLPDGRLQDTNLPPAARQLADWDAQGLILEKAFAASRRITPETMLSAYNTLQGELRRDIENDPHDLLPAEKALKLRAAFLSSVNTTRFATENKRRGVDLLSAPRP